MPSDQPFRFDVVGELCGAPSRVRGYLQSYFSTDASPGYTGRWFEQIIATSDPMQFTPSDIVAVKALSVDVPIAVAAPLLFDPEVRAHATELLGAVPAPGTQLAEVDHDELDDGRPLAQLYVWLRDQHGMGPTTTSKLMAAKRPALVPIRDEVVSALLGAPRRWWAPMRTLVEDADLVRLLMDECADVVPADVTLLRRLDVALWRWGKDEQQRDV